MAFDIDTYREDNCSYVRNRLLSSYKSASTAIGLDQHNVPSNSVALLHQPSATSRIQSEFVVDKLRWTYRIHLLIRSQYGDTTVTRAIHCTGAKPKHHLTDETQRSD